MVSSGFRCQAIEDRGQKTDAKNLEMDTPSDLCFLSSVICFLTFGGRCRQVEAQSIGFQFHFCAPLLQILGDKFDDALMGGLAVAGDRHGFAELEIKRKIRIDGADFFYPLTVAVKICF